MNILGVDPGATGGLAIVDSGRMTIISGCRMPTYKFKKKALVSPNGVMAFVGSISIDLVVVEQVNSMPGQGHTGAFSFGRTTGAIEAVAGLLCPRLEWVPPSTWKKHFGLSKNKQASIDLAKRTFGYSYQWQHLADDGIAEAALITRYWIDKYLAN